MRKLSLNGNTLKYIAAAAMALDHIGMMFVPSTSFPGALLRFAGRLTCPVMCLFLSEGYSHTSSKKKYAARLGVFAALSQPAFTFAHHGEIFISDFFTDYNMLFTLFISFLTLAAYDNIKNGALRWMCITVLVAVSAFCDWGIFAPIVILMFYILKNDNGKKTAAYIAASAACVVCGAIFCAVNGYHWYDELWQMGLFLFIPVIYVYNGERGSLKPFHKWFFYVFYPLQYAVLGIIKYILIQA